MQGRVLCPPETNVDEHGFMPFGMQGRALCPSGTNVEEHDFAPFGERAGTRPAPAKHPHWMP